MSDLPSQLPQDYILVGMIQKPYGLLGEVKIKPETFDFNRHETLKTVYARNREGEVTPLQVRANRADNLWWYLKFDDHRTPEAVAFLSGRELLIDAAEKLELPEGMVFFSEVPGMAVMDELGNTVGEILEIRETGSTEYLIVKTAAAEVPVPWNDHFVTKIDKAARVIHMDLSQLRGILL
jgi:16S rRNA processing protein RimM